MSFRLPEEGYVRLLTWRRLCQTPYLKKVMSDSTWRRLCQTPYLKKVMADSNWRRLCQTPPEEGYVRLHLKKVMSDSRCALIWISTFLLWSYYIACYRFVPLFTSVLTTLNDRLIKVVKTKVDSGTNPQYSWDRNRQRDNTSGS
jgi:hypothetical protein